MHRRGFLGALLGAPLVGNQVASQVGGAISVSSEPSNDEWSPSEEWPPLKKAYDRAHSKAVDEHQRKVHAMPVPYWIDQKKSWSPAFKQHVLRQEELEFRRKWPAPWSEDITDEFMIAALIKRPGVV